MHTDLYHRPWPDMLPGNGEVREVGRVAAAEARVLRGDQKVSRNRITVAVNLSAGLPHSFLCESLAQTLRDETGESVLLVQLAAADKAALNIEAILSSRVSLPRNNGAISKITLEVSDGAGVVESVHSLLGYLSTQFDSVIVQGELQGTPLWTLLEFASLADTIYLFLAPQTEDCRRHDSFVSDLRARAHGEALDLRAVLCVSGKEATDEIASFCNAHAHVFIHDCPSPQIFSGDTAGLTSLFKKDLRRLAREIGHCRLGLAFSAGGAKGLAHIGVLQILEENGIEVDVIAGCSMGAYIAAAWAVGCDGPELEKLARENEKLVGFWGLLDPTVLPRQGFLHGDAVRRRLEKTVGKAQFSGLVRPIRVVATNLDTLDRGVFASGLVAEAVQASCAIPGVVVPVTIGTETYIDGGVSDPLPVDVLTEMKVDRIIAVNAIPPSAFLRCCREVEREQAELSQKRFHLLRNINQQINYFARGNILDIMMRAVHGGQIRMAEQACDCADVVLRPLAIDAHWHDFNHPAKYIALGRKVALQHLDELKALVPKKASSHEHESSHHEMAALI